MKRTPYLIAAIITLLLLSACSASQPEEPMAAEVVEVEPANQVEDMEHEPDDEAMTASGGQTDEMESAEEMMDDSAKESVEMDEDETMASETVDSETMASDAAVSDRPAWQQVALTNAKTGETFTLADFAGKTVFVEPMATWCSNCRRQLHNVRNAKLQFDGDDVIFVGLSVETNIGDGDLANYARDQGFDWTFAVVTPEMLGLLADEFGQSIANPPATPHFVIRPDGSYTDLVTGIEPSEQIVAQIMAAQG